MKNFTHYLHKIAEGEILPEKEMAEAFTSLISGDVTPGQMGAFLFGLRVRGEAISEITGAVQAMREKCIKVKAPEGAVDIVGTGGDGSGSYNISTAAALVVASAGIFVAKHGNRAITSQSGASDVLQEIGFNISLTPEEIGQMIEKTGFGYMPAPLHHPAIRNVLPIRVEIKARTIFNLLGPLSNPAMVKYMVVGVFAPEWVEVLAHTLHRLGVKRAWVVHGSGFDELTPIGDNLVAELRDGKVKTFTLKPQDYGITPCSADDLRGGDAIQNARAIHELMDGKRCAFRDAVVMTAAAGLIVAGKCDRFSAALSEVRQVIDRGASLRLLRKASNFSRQFQGKNPYE